MPNLSVAYLDFPKSSVFDGGLTPFPSFHVPWLSHILLNVLTILCRGMCKSIVYYPLSPLQPSTSTLSGGRGGGDVRCHRGPRNPPTRNLEPIFTPLQGA